MELRLDKSFRVYIGYDPREVDAFAVARSSILQNTPHYVPISGLILSDLRKEGLYQRPTSRKDGRLWDVISEHPMATEFACSRFLVPYLCHRGWALFMDCDMLIRKDLTKIIDEANDEKAIMVVKHHFDPPEGTKMDNQVQTRYKRKNWSSVMLFNCDHPANKRLTLKMINEVPGRDLHGFCWLEDDEIGELDPKWNYLVGHSDPFVDPSIVHFTDGIPSMPGYEDCEYADEWRDALLKWAR